MLKLIFPLIGLALFAVVVFDFTRQYLKATSTGWQRIWDAGRGSATIVWQQFGLAVGGLVAASSTLTDWVCQLVNAPGADEAIKGAISSYLTPTTVAAGLVLYAGISIWARARTL